MLPEIRLGARHNYVAFFLTRACNLRCDYCLADSATAGKTRRRGHLSADEWIRAANRLVLRDDLPLTLQGGEPTLHPGFYRIVRETREDLKMDLLTNLTFDAAEFARRVPVWRFSREAPYAAIRASYHPGQNDLEEMIAKTKLLSDRGFRVGLYGILHPDRRIAGAILHAQERCEQEGIDFRTKEFLGVWKGRLYGTYKFDDAVASKDTRTCRCRTTELLVGPSGAVHRCHTALYTGTDAIGKILDPAFSGREIDQFRPCAMFGRCNPCDVKIKTNRFQIFGHTSVEIHDIR